MGDLKQSYSHGAIMRIKLENFVTYDSLEFTPGPNLNVIIGPNGTGKSTIVCAICLGMAGKPTVLGRAAQLSDYIKYGKNRAVIEIELVNTKGRNYVIKREIHKDGHSEWYMNGKVAKLKEIEELVNELNIQIGNLCQFLPQEKVTEFARMNPQQILESTERAVGGNELFELHDDLKNQRETAKLLERDLINLKESLKKEETINARLEGQVKSFLEKKKFEENISLLKKKRSWMLYTEKRKEHENLKKEKEIITNKLNELDQTFGPLREKRAAIEAKIFKEKNNLVTKSNVVKEKSNTLNTINRKRDELNDKVLDIKNEYDNKEEQFKQRNNNIREIKLSIDALKTEYEEAKEDLANIKQKEAELRAKELDFRKNIENSFNKEHESRRRITQLKGEKEELQKKITNLKSVKSEKMRKLRQHYKDAYQAIEWLNENRDKFEGEVYEPMLLLINLKNQEAAKYVESLIPKKDLNALFLFENSNDMHKFVTELRDRRGLVVNAAIVPKDKSSSFDRPYPIEELKRYGFRSYIREVIDAPEAILRYLCLYSNIHCVPFGDENTHKNLSSILPKIPNLKRIYTSTHQYSFSRSRYTGDTTSSSNEVPEAFYLTSSVDQKELNETIDREREVTAELDELTAKLQKLNDEKAKNEKCIEQIKAECNKLRERAYHIENIDKKIKAKQLLLDKAESQKIDLVSEAKKKCRLLNEMAKKRVALYADVHEHAQKMMQANKDMVLIAYHIVLNQHEFRQTEAELRNYDAKKQEFQRALEMHAGNLKQAKEDAHAALQHALKICEIQNANDLPSELKTKFSKLPSTLDEIDAEISEIEAKSQCSYEVDKQVVDDFNARKKMIEQLQKDCEKKETKLNNHKNNFEETKNSWNEQIDTMVKAISEKFSALFRLLKCSGEVELGRPDNPEDFAQYGICIKVSFRSEERLQELTAWQQSGGEKSVATMLYMIALQEMTKCPFRVVDEINQGMDPVNERKVFDIIVRNSSMKSSAQYFLLTPKLLPDLPFDNKTKVICVFNGPHSLPHSKYNLREFIETKKRLTEE